MSWINNDTIVEESTNTIINNKESDVVLDNENSKEYTDDDIQESNSTSFTDVVSEANDQTDKVQEVKKDITADELKKETTILEAPLNWTDPIVWHDPTLYKGAIVKHIETDRGKKEASDSPQTSHKIDGVYFPLIKINQRIINNDDIIYMKLYSSGILPQLFLKIRDSNDSITNLNSSGADTEIVIVITPPLNGIYKKIKLPFYIDNVFENIDNGERILNYSCTMKIPILKQNYTTSMNYPDKKQWPGCIKCNQTEQEIPNSWEMLHFIANECKLGFASTKQCKEIQDRNWRLFNSYNSLEQALEKEKEFAGTTEDEAIFDWWIDFYGYIVMINVPWVFNEDIDIKHLGIYGILGPQQTADNQKAPAPVIKLVNRTLTTSKDTTTFAFSHNLLIRRYEIITDNSLYEEGTCSTFNIFQPKGAGGNNGCLRFDVQVEEQSVAGFAVERYTTQRTFMRSVDMSGTNRQQKKNIFKRYFQNKRAKRLVVELETCNLGLQRGTLINVVLTETNPQNKSAIIANMKNINAQNVPGTDQLQVDSSAPLQGQTSDTAPSNSEHVQDASIEVINQGLSGLYYIDEITYEYDINEEQKIYQKLYLIKKGVWGNYMSRGGYAQIDHNSLDANKNITN